MDKTTKTRLIMRLILSILMQLISMALNPILKLFISKEEINK